MSVYAVIMAGGAGTRFWPASRQLRPKQLLSLAGHPGETLLAASARRIRALVPPERTYVATGTHLVEATRSAVPEIPKENFLAEPIARNTAPCVGWATATVRQRDPNARVLVLPSDQFVENDDVFVECLREGLEGANAGYFTTIGIPPTRPETGFGYIEVGSLISGSLFRAERFVEKPDRARAEEYLRGGRHLWNAGMFFFQAEPMLEAIKHHLPELSQGLDELDHARSRGEEQRVLPDVFHRLPSISIDHGIMEKVPRIAVVRGAGIGWNDVGSWQSTWELAPKDGGQNAVPEGTVLVDARGNYVADRRGAGAPARVVALVGVSDLVVVDTGDALLVMHKDRAQDVREVTAELTRTGRRELV